MSKERPGVMLYFKTAMPLLSLSLEDQGRMFSAILRYAKEGEEPRLEDDLTLAFAWNYLKNGIDEDEKRYQSICERNSKNAHLRWEREAAACGGMPPDAVDANINNNNKNKNKNNPNPIVQFQSLLPGFGQAPGGAPPGGEDVALRRERIRRMLMEHDGDDGAPGQEK